MMGMAVFGIQADSAEITSGQDNHEKELALLLSLIHFSDVLLSINVVIIIQFPPLKVPDD